MNLGRKPEDSPSSPGALAQAPAAPKISYPSISFNDKAAEEFLGNFEGKIGDVITATVTMKVTSLRKDDYGQSVGFDMTDIDDIKSADADGDNDGDTDEDDAQEKILGYKRPTTKKETPDMSSDSLQSP